jgi:hypothetical protein
MIQVNAAELITALGTTTGGPLLMAFAREVPPQFPRTVDAWWTWMTNGVRQYLSLKGVDSHPTDVDLSAGTPKT